MSISEGVPKVSSANRVFVKYPGFYRTFVGPGDKRAVRYDPASLSYVVSEFIALSAAEIAIGPHSPAAMFIDGLPPVLRSRVVILDRQQKVGEQYEAFLAPIAREFGLTFANHGTIEIPPQVPHAVRDALQVVVPGLYDFLIAARSRAMLDLDVARLKTSVEQLRSLVKDRTSYAHLSLLLGALGSYHAVEAPALILLPEAHPEQETRFKEFVEDIAYQRLSAEAAELGIPDRVERALALMKRALQGALKVPLIATAAKAGSKALLTAAGAKNVDIDPSSLVGQAGYYPPISSFADAYRRAEPEWRARRVPAEATGLYARLLREGYREDLSAPQPPFSFFQGRPIEQFVRSPDEDL